jgi:hypothetical protein
MACCTACAQLRIVHSLDDRIAAEAVDDTEVAGAHGLRAADDVLQQRLAGQGLQDLGKCRAHALALPGCQYDDA